jgi:hypothetical protein
MVFKEIDLKTGEGKAEQIIALLAVPNQGVQLIKLGALEPINPELSQCDRTESL